MKSSRIAGHKYELLALDPDEEGEVNACLISANDNQPNQPTVLYVHGYIDYFFHPHVSQFFTSHHVNFYALELRKYGHALMAHQRPNYCRDITEYFEDVDAAITQIVQEEAGPIYLMGHSTGGLITASYLNDGGRKDQVSGLILNSPFLEMNMPLWLRKIVFPLAKVLGNMAPNWGINGMIPDIYPKSMHAQYAGEWDFDLRLKPLNGFKTYFAWISAIMVAQKKLHYFSNIQVPILLLHASDSFIPTTHSDRVMHADIVLNHAHMIQWGPSLGKEITLMEIANATHDVFLAAPPVRNEALQKTLDWIRNK